MPPFLNAIPKQAGSNQQQCLEILRWFPQFQSCLCYFLDHGQHNISVRAIAAFINIQLPFQKYPHSIVSSTSPFFTSRELLAPNAQGVLLVPYIRRLVVTGQDTEIVMHGFFGNDWVEGVGALHEFERRNYLFAAKSSNWIGVKEAYDILPYETVPFLTPLQNVSEREMQIADDKWSEWIFMQDWVLGPRLEAMTRVVDDETDMRED